MIRWKQRDIHEKREARKLNIAKLNSELSLNAVLRPRIETIKTGVSEKGVDYYRSVQRRLKEDPSGEKPQTGAANQPTYDMMMGQLLGDIWREASWMVDGAKWENGMVQMDGKKVDEKAGEPEWARAAVPDGKKDSLKARLEERLSWHVAELDRRDKEVRVEIAEEEKEQKKHITSDDIHEGFSQTAVVAPKPSPLDDKPKPKQKVKEQTIEVLNPTTVGCFQRDRANVRAR